MPNNTVSTLATDLTTLCDNVLSQETQAEAVETIGKMRDLMTSFTPQKHELVAKLGYDVTRPYSPTQAFTNLSDSLQALTSELAPNAQQTPVDQIDTDALRSMLSDLLTDIQSTMKELKAIKKKAIVIPPSAFDSPVIPLQNGPLINAFLSLSGERIRKDDSNRLTDNNGHMIAVEQPDGFVFGSSAKKLMMAILLYFSQTTLYCSDNPDTAVRIPLIAYGAANGLRLIPEKKDTEEEQEAERRRVAERQKEFRKTILRDLNSIGMLRFSGSETKKNRTKVNAKKNADTMGKETDQNDKEEDQSETTDFSFSDQKLITSGTIKNGTIVVELNPEMARYIVHCPLMQFPPILLKNDNRKPNAFTLGVKISLHYSNRKNQGSGTNNTLSVKSLLTCAPEIPTYEQSTAKNQRNWKQKIMEPLESALNENVRIGYLTSWTYRDPSAKTTYSTEMVKFFSWEQYRRLMIDYEIAEEYQINTMKKKKASEKPKADQDQRNTKRKKKAAEKTTKEKPAESTTDNRAQEHDEYIMFLPPR